MVQLSFRLKASGDFRPGGQVGGQVGVQSDPTPMWRGVGVRSYAKAIRLLKFTILSSRLLKKRFRSRSPVVLIRTALLTRLLINCSVVRQNNSWEVIRTSAILWVRKITRLSPILNRIVFS